jgi:Alginate export
MDIRHLPSSPGGDHAYNSHKFNHKYNKVLGGLALLTFSCLNALAQSAQAPPPPALGPEAASREATRPAPKQEKAPIKFGALTVTGNLRTRVENWDWFDTTAAEDGYTFGAMTLRLAIGQSKERFEWLVEGQAPVLFGLPTNAVAPPPQGPLGMGGAYFAANGGRNASAVFKQGFVRFKGILGDTASSLKLGRFEFIDGLETTPDDATLAALKRARVAQRLIGSFGFTHVTRSFDGLHYAHQTKASNLTFFAARPTSGAFDLNANKELDIDLYYGAFTKPLKSKSSAGEYRLFTMHYHDGRRVLKPDNRITALRSADLGKIRMTTFGGNFIGAYKTGRGRTDVMLWGAGQFGNWGNLDHRAGAIAIEVGYQPSGKIADKIKPWVRGGYFRSTGDGDPTDAMHGTFFLNSLAQPYARFPFFNLMNNEDSHAALLLKPHPGAAH